MISALNYLVLEIVAITTLVLFALITLASYPKNRNAWLFALICLSGAAFLFYRTGFKADAAYRIDPGWWLVPVQLLMSAGAGLWMLLCYSLFQDPRRLPRWLLVLFSLQVLLSMVAVNTYPMDITALSRVRLDSPVRILLLPTPLLLQGLFGILALVFTVRGWSGDLVNSRRLVRFVCVVYLSLVFIGLRLVEIALLRGDAGLRLLLNDAITLLAAVSACAMLVLTARIDIAALTAPLTATAVALGRQPRETKSKMTDADYRKFQAVFEADKAWLEHGLTLGSLAVKMAIPEYRLRQLIHSRLGYRHFNTLLHTYRIREACRLLADPGNPKMPVLTIALSVGYQSIGPFNQAFREIVGDTPTGYRKAQLSQKNLPDSW